MIGESAPCLIGAPCFPEMLQIDDWRECSLSDWSPMFS